MTTERPPEWAIKRACDLLNEELGMPGFWKPGNYDLHSYVRTVAKLVAKYEEEVDPLLIEAREICAKLAEERGSSVLAAKYRTGRQDRGIVMSPALAALKRGIEIGKGEA